MSSALTIWSFYCFTNISSPEFLVPKLLLIAKKKLIKGTILLAKEGFNGSISGKTQDLEILFAELIKLANVTKDEVNLKINPCNNHAFSKFKIKLKKEIVTLGVGEINVNKLKGMYIKPQDWDNFICRQDVVLVDTRNDYEVEAGTFVKAVKPNIANFREFPQWLKSNMEQIKNKKVAMFCTGGIRCEKSTSYLKSLGHQEVYHLEGGILQYLQDTQNKNSMWAGQCFVFDDRRGVDIDLADPRKID